MTLQRIEPPQASTVFHCLLNSILIWIRTLLQRTQQGRSTTSKLFIRKFNAFNVFEKKPIPIATTLNKCSKSFPLIKRQGKHFLVLSWQRFLSIRAVVLENYADPKTNKVWANKVESLFKKQFPILEKFANDRRC